MQLKEYNRSSKIVIIKKEEVIKNRLNRIKAREFIAQ